MRGCECGGDCPSCGSCSGHMLDCPDRPRVVRQEAIEVNRTKTWPRKPPKDTRCDAHTGTGSDHLGKPVVFRCQEQATETCLATKGVVPELWLCDEHAAAMEQSGWVRRNPRRKP